MQQRAHLVLLAALAASLVLALLGTPGQAGTAEAPEITDAAGDQVILEAVPGCVPGAGCQAATRIDILTVWVDAETATQFNVNIALSNAPSGATTATSRYEVHATVGGTEVVSVATAAGGASNSPAAPTSNVAAATADGNTLILTIDKSVYGAGATDGAALTGLYVEGFSVVPSPAPAVDYAYDRAPDSGAGTDYVFGAGAGGSPGDSDGDGLDDAKENATFGGLAQNGTADPDQDGLNNSREFALGTNATKADTDGDGLDDGDDSDPLDATKPALRPGEDRDGDGLNDTWEVEHFNTTAAQSGGGDPDADTLNNTRELALGTDPNAADTDGDGIDDADDRAPLSASSEATDGGRRPELYAGSLMFAAAATFCLLGLARGI